MQTYIFLFFFVMCFVAYSENVQFFPPNDERIEYMGRFDFRDIAHSVCFDWAGSSIVTGFRGDSLKIFLSDQGNTFFNVHIDDAVTKIHLQNGKPSNFTFKVEGGEHRVRIVKISEAAFGMSCFSGMEADDLIKIKKNTTRKLVFYGWGNIGPNATCKGASQFESIDESWPVYLSQHFDSDYHIICWNGKGLLKNVKSKERICKDNMPSYFHEICGSRKCGDFDFSTFQPDAVFIYLGTNDYIDPLVPVPTEEEWVEQYTAILQNFTKLYTNNPHYFLVDSWPIPVFPPLWNRYVEEIAEEWRERISVSIIDTAKVIPWPEDRGCDEHPNHNGHELYAEFMKPIVKDALNW